LHASLLLTVIIWGGTFVAIRYLVVRYGATHTMILRAGLSSLVFGLLLLRYWRVVVTIPWQMWKRLALIAFCGIAVNNVAITYSQDYITAALASLVVTSNAVFTVIFSRILLGERMTRRTLAGIGLAFAGFLIVLLYGGAEARFSADNVVGVLILVCAPFGWAIYTVLSKPLLETYEPVVVAGVTTVLGGLMVSPIVLANLDVATTITDLSARGWLAAAVMSVLAIVVGYVLWYRSLRQLSPAQAAVYMYFVPAFGVVFAWLILDERITGWLLLGGITILTGVVVTNAGRRTRRDAELGKGGP
jgi:drug/metabolite transporter (DMT)-like permease